VVTTTTVYRNQTPERFRVVRGLAHETIILDSEWQRGPTPCAGCADAEKLAALWNRIGPEERAAARQITMEEALT
jgi:hypothetical protein